MKKKFNVDDEIIFSRYENYSYFNFNNVDFILIVLTGLYERGIISRKKLIGQLKSLRNNNLLNKKNTYYCSINNSWYHGVYGIEIFKELYENYNLYKISIVKLLEVIQLYFNKKYNYCINYLVHKIIKNLFDRFKSYNYSNFIFDLNVEFKIDNFPKVEYKYYETYCNCCGKKMYELNKSDTEKEFNYIINFFKDYKK